MYPTLPVTTRSSEYFGFALSRGDGKQQTSMWLLNGTIPELLNGQVFANYVLMDEQSHHRHPNESSILYVDLKKLAKMNTQAGELASILINEAKELKDPEVKSILQNLKQNFNEFKDDMEVRNIMTRAEQLEARGEARSEAKLLPVIEEQKEQISEKDKEISEKDKEISEKDREISELKARLAEATRSKV